MHYRIVKHYGGYYAQRRQCWFWWIDLDQARSNLKDAEETIEREMKEEEKREKKPILIKRYKI